MSTAHLDRTKPIAILGGGKVGVAFARQFVRVGLGVNIASSGAPTNLKMVVDFMAPGAHAMHAEDAVAAAQVVVLATPLRKYRTLNADALRGKVVIDAMNFWRESDGEMRELIEAPSSSEMVQDHLEGVALVKALNHIGYHEFEEDHRDPGADDRRALAAASDDEDARAVVLELIELLGFDPVDAGPLSAGIALEPGTQIFAASHGRDSFERLLGDEQNLPERRIA